MTNETIKIPRTIDKSIIDLFIKLGKTHSVDAINIQGLGFASIGNVNLLSINENKDIQTILSLDSELINQCSMQIHGLLISYYRSGQQQSKSAVYDEICLTHQPQKGSLSHTKKLEIVALINSELNAFKPGKIVQGVLSEEQNQLLAIHNSTLERLELLNEHLIEKSSDFREKLETQFNEKSNAFENELENRKSQLEKLHKQKITVIEEREQDLSIKLKEIDNRDNTHARREIRNGMLDDVKARIKNFGVSESTAKKRVPVLIGIIFLAIFLIILLLFTEYEISLLEKSQESSNKIYWLWTRFGLFCFTLLGTIFFYIKWQKSWADYHSNSEFQLQQFYLDVNRANWIIESCLEWSKETDKPLPLELVNSISNNLFASENGELDKVTHPADELASALLGSASKLKLNVGGNQLEFDKPGKISTKPRPGK